MVLHLQAKKIHDNTQKISPTLDKFGFYSKRDASEYVITDEEVQFVHRYKGDPIEPVNLWLIIILNLVLKL